MDAGNDDEYTSTTSVSTGGYYDYAFRFSGNAGATWTYCDTDGSGPSDPYDADFAGLLQVGTDADSDGYVDEADGGDDCDDTDDTIYPGATEVYDDGIDQDCDGSDATTPVLTVDELTTGDLVFSELLINPDYVADSLGEYFEFVNVSGMEVDLQGLVVKRNGTTAFTVGSSIVVADGEYVVFGVSGNPAVNGGYTPDYVYSYTACTLTNTGASLALANSGGTIDSVTYAGGFGGYTTGTATGLDPAKLDPTLNDSGSNWFAQSTEIVAGGDLGTPGAASDCP